MPTLPDNYLQRDLSPLRQAVLGDGSVAVTGKPVQGQNVSIQGMGGIGKSVLAAALVRDQTVLQAYPDGIFWLALGQTPNLVALQTSLAIDLGEANPHFTDEAAGKDALGRLLQNRRCLIVLDDIWQLAHYNRAFDVLGDHSQLLLTTRDNSIANRLSAYQHPLEELDPPQALALLRQWTGLDELPPVAPAVARECGYLPLALAMVGAYLRDKPQRWQRVLDKLQTADLEKHKINRQLLPGYQYQLFQAVQVSLEALEDIGDIDAADAQQRYLDFAVFPEDTPVPETVLATLWQPLGLDEDDTEELLDELVDKSLLRWNDQGRLYLHDLQYDYIRKRVEDLPALHGRWLEAYRQACPDGWASGPDDGYFFGHLVYHLMAAGRRDELRQLLLDYGWLQAQLAASGINGLIADYDDLSDDKTVRLVQNSLRLSSHVLAISPEQLMPRLWGHLMDRPPPGVKSLLDQGVSCQLEVWLQPRFSNLAVPDGPQLRTLSGHSDWVSSVAISPDGRSGLSGSSDKTLKVWDIASGKEARTLSGHTGLVRSVVISPDGRYGLSGSSDKTLKVWDIASGKELRTLSGHVHWVRAAAISADGKLGLSGSSDKTLKVWDIASGKEVYTLSGHSSFVNSVAISADGRLGLSGSSDKTLKVWDIESGKEVYTLSGHSGWVNSVAMSVDGKLGLSGSSDNTLKVWDIASGKELHTFSGHSGSVNSVAISWDGSYGLSGSFDNTLKVWDIASGKESYTLSRHSGVIKSMVMSLDGRLGLSGSSDKTLKVWDIASSEELRTLLGHSGFINSVAISADGRLGLSGSDDRMLKVWDIASGECQATFTGDHIFSSCSLTSDKCSIIAGDAAGVVHSFSLREPD